MQVVDCITACVAVEWVRAIYGSRPCLVRYTVPPALTVTDVLNPRIQVRARNLFDATHHGISRSRRRDPSVSLSRS